MMQTLTNTHRSEVDRRLAPGTAVRLRSARGELRLTRGRVWLTGRHAAGDLLLGRGERLRIDARDDVVIEPYDAGAEAAFQLVELPRPAFTMALDVALRRTAAGLAFGLARAFAALARSAASSARRAQGHIA